MVLSFSSIDDATVNYSTGNNCFFMIEKCFTFSNHLFTFYCNRKVWGMSLNLLTDSWFPTKLMLKSTINVKTPFYVAYVLTSCRCTFSSYYKLSVLFELSWYIYWCIFISATRFNERCFEREREREREREKERKRETETETERETESDREKEGLHFVDNVIFKEKAKGLFYFVCETFKYNF